MNRRQLLMGAVAVAVAPSLPIPEPVKEVFPRIRTGLPPTTWRLINQGVVNPPILFLNQTQRALALEAGAVNYVNNMLLWGSTEVKGLGGLFDEA